MSDPEEKKVYVIAAREVQAVKIGVTSQSPEERLKQLKTGSPHELEVMHWYETGLAEEVESYMHKKMENKKGIKHKKGEWFELEGNFESKFEELKKLPAIAETAIAWSNIKEKTVKELEKVGDKTPLYVLVAFLSLFARAFIVDSEALEEEYETYDTNVSDKEVKDEIMKLMERVPIKEIEEEKMIEGYYKDANFTMSNNISASGDISFEDGQ